MKKILPAAIIFLGAVLAATPALAFTSASVTNMEAPYATIYSSNFDALVMDFTLNVSGADTLNALSLANDGTADYLSHIKYMTLWADAGATGFQGFGIDTKLGDFAYSTTYGSWYIQDLNFKITGSQRLFVSVESYSGMSKSGTILMKLPVLTDNNLNGIFDIGDFGIFMASKDNGPTDSSLTNANSQVLSTFSVDSQGPKIVLTNLTNGQTINTSSFTIEGKARDQGNSNVRDLSIFIDNQEYAVQELDTAYYAWRYDWQNISDGAHTISLQGHDSWGNFTQTGEITINVKAQAISVANSSATIDKDSIINDGLDKATVNVLLKDQSNLPLSDRTLTVEASSGTIISMPNAVSDTTGAVSFEIRSTSLGAKTLVLKVGDLTIKSLSLTVTNPALAGTSATYGDLIKASGAAVYYYGYNGKRYVFPTLATYNTWYSDFSTVENIADDQLSMIPIGGNVTFKPGVSLVKITTDPKVYAVDAHGVLRWIKTEALAKVFYGDNWASKVLDVPDAFFTDYKLGADISVEGDFTPADVQNSATSISADKNILQPIS